MDIIYKHPIVPVCPEQLGGLSTPRLPAEIKNGNGKSLWYDNMGKVVDIKGNNVTPQFLKGAVETKKLVNTLGIKYAILKEKSPSCGVLNIFDGSFSGILTEEMGVTAAALYDQGTKIFSSFEKRRLLSFFIDRVM